MRMCDRLEEIPACPITVHGSCGTKSRLLRLIKVNPGLRGRREKGGIHGSVVKTWRLKTEICLNVTKYLQRFI